MDSIDYQLLDYLSDAAVNVAQLVSPSASESFNKAPLRLSINQILSRLEILRRHGLATLSGEGELLLPSHYDSSDDLSVYWVLLTEKGGAEWEALYAPDWTRYVSVSVDLDLPDEERLELEALQIDRLNEIEKDLHPLVSHLEIIKVTPWHVTYWKSFDRGYRLTANLPRGGVDNLPDYIWAMIATRS